MMAGGGSAEERLDKVVHLIAADMVAEVCSCYVLRAGEVLELFATEGLKKSAIHNTRLRVGEGLVGTIAAHARPMALADARSHPAFAYRPETGEEIYHSLLGVPIVRGGRVLGVLVVQNRAKRQYAEEETETLETVAMVLAELLASGELIQRDELTPVDGIALLPLRIEGVRLNEGIGIGVAVMHRPRVVVRNVVADNPEKELARFADAVTGMHTAIDALLEAPTLADSGEHRDVLETYRMFARDKGWLGKIAEAIRSGLTAEAAVQRVEDEMRARMQQMADPYLRERLHDLEDLAARLLRHLAGSEDTAAHGSLPENAILVARSMGPAELLDYDSRRLRGLVLEEGSATAHVAIIARALDIPVVGRAQGILDKIEPFDPVIVDGDIAQVLIRPADEIQDVFKQSLQERMQRRAKYASDRDLPAVSRDGARVALNINAGLLVDLQALTETGADGIGLYRTELPFMVRSQLPDVDTQAVLYKKILDQAQGKPVAFRTLDVGSDKALPYWQGVAEENPALGWRSIRITLDRPTILRQQLRALVQAGAGRELSVMFPMIAEVGEFDRARALLDLEMARHVKKGGIAPSKLRVGTMLEVPALAFHLDRLLARVDFVSIGSNDLAQFLFAADRGNPQVSDRYDTLSPSFLNFLQTVRNACEKAKVPVALCGEMGGKPLEAMVLIALGFRSLSMSPSAIGPVKAMLRSLDVGALVAFLQEWLPGADSSLRGRIRAFARDHGVNLP